MSRLIEQVREWLTSNGYTDNDRYAYEVQTVENGAVCITVRTVAERRCDRCSRRGPGLLARLSGQCSACKRVELAREVALSQQTDRLERVLGEHFVFVEKSDVPLVRPVVKGPTAVRFFLAGICPDSVPS